AAAAGREAGRARRGALPRVKPKPRSSGSATTVAKRLPSGPGATSSLFGLISSCQFFWITGLVLSVFRRRREGGRRGGRKCPGREYSKMREKSASPVALVPRLSHPAALARAAAVIRDRRHVAYGGNPEPGRLPCAQR